MPDAVGFNPEQRPRNDGKMPCVPDHELIRKIGGGAYGEVWLARHARLGTLRAVKIVRRDQFDNDRPFQREFDGIRRYEPISRGHPNLVAILHVGGTDDCFFYVMELADDAVENPKPETNAADAPALRTSDFGLPSDFGFRNSDLYTPHTLRSELKRHGALPIDRCLEIGLGLADALTHLHARGLVHRDVKPSNVIFVGGVAKLADIGLVAAVSDSCSFVGTEGYIPPEGPGTPSADCYALGKLLYELSTGHDRTAWPEPPADLPTRSDRQRLLELNAILHKACAADARQRYQFAEEMQVELQLLWKGGSLRARRTVQRRIAVAKAVSATALVILILGAVGWFVVETLKQRERNTRVERRGTESIEAWNLYQKGRYLVESQSGKELRTAIDYFQRAIELDPGFARAYEWLGSAYCNLVFHTNVLAREYFTKAEVNVRRALELDPSQAEAWSGLGFIKTKYGTNLDEAERLLRYSLQLDPNNLVCLHRLAICLSDRGKSEESIALHRRILEVDPTKLDFNRSLGLRLFQARRFDEAISALRRAAELHPNNALAWIDLGAALAHVGRSDEAAAALCTAKRLNGASDSELSTLKQEYGRIGIKAFWLRDGLRPQAAGTNYFKPFNAARLCARAGDYEGAIEWLQRLEDDPLEFSRAMLSPEFDPLRSDSRFTELLTRIGLLESTR